MLKKKVLFIVPSLRRAGAEMQLVSLVNSLPTDRFEKHLVFYRSEDDLKTDVTREQVTIHTLKRQSKFDLSLAKSIGKLIDENQIDVLHCTLQNAMLYGFMGRFFADRKPSVITVIHTTENANFKHNVADWILYRPLLKRCSQVWFVSSIQADRWINSYPFLASIKRVIHNGIDLERFNPANFDRQGRELRRNLNISDDDIALCCVAGFRSEKLHSVLINAMSKVHANRQSVRLLLAGTGPTQAAARQQVTDLGLDDVVVFLDGVRDVRPLLAASDMKILVSAAETFSMAMLEAMAMQVPVITTSVGGAAEAIEDGLNGYLIQPGDVGMLASAIDKLLIDDELRQSMGLRAREAVVSRFEEQSMITRSADELMASPAVSAANQRQNQVGEQ